MTSATSLDNPSIAGSDSYRVCNLKTLVKLLQSGILKGVPLLTQVFLPSGTSPNMFTWGFLIEEIPN